MTPSVFKLSELGRLYADCLEKYSVKVTNKINITSFKERLLAACSDLTAVPHGRDVLLTFHENMGEVPVLQKLSENSDSNTVHLMHTAKVIRNEIHFQDHTDSRDHLMWHCQTVKTFCPSDIADPCEHDAGGSRQLWQC